MVRHLVQDVMSLRDTLSLQNIKSYKQVFVWALQDSLYSIK